ncbi:MAG: tRNA-dihydrouridine synthase family protein [Treponema sp.]|nr:tRNA-dihydrouridine synthase family protein [Treponema sp.]
MGIQKVPFYLAPMAEISHRALREIIEDFGGCDAYFSEMISAGALLANGPFEKWYLDTAPNPQKLIFQLVGSDPEIMSKAAFQLDKLECGGIDINMGCSAPLIRKTGAGAAWMASVDKAGELISKIRPHVKRQLSVKLRIGFKEDFEYLVRFCRRLQDEGVELITLHPRTVMEKFKRVARWEYVGKLKQELKIPVAGNGDIANAQDLVRRASGNCDAVMVGRAAVRQPWIFAEARNIEEEINHGGHGVTRSKEEEGGEKVLAETSNLWFARRGEEGVYFNLNLCVSVPPCDYNIEMIGVSPKVFTVGTLPTFEEIGLRFIELLAKYQPPEFYISRARRFFGFFCDNLKWGNYLKNLLNKEETLAGIEKVWKEYFKENGE